MQVILSILLYLNVISSPGTYTTSQIQGDVTANQPQVTVVQSDPGLLDYIVTTYKKQVAGITVLDDGQMR